MSHILLISNSFPFHPGEQFLEEEVKYWVDKNVKIRIAPLKANGPPRNLPQGAKVEMFLVRAGRQKRTLLLFALRALTSIHFFRELRLLLATRKLNYQTARRALICISKVFLYAHVLARYVKLAGPIDVLYSYWNDLPAYAACLVKKSGGIRRIVTRAHGYDLYEERQMSGYMPLKRQFISGFDKVYAVSSQGAEYFSKTYGTQTGQVDTYSLGVAIDDNNSVALCTIGRIHIVSVSFCVAVKRIDKIIDAVAKFGAKHQGVAVSWDHIGDGPFLESLRAMAERAFSPIGNIEFRFLGSLPNSAVRQYLSSTPVDVFVNASESEGVPVSIMEAMAAGIPAVAPNVGGVSELVSNECGYLLSPRPTADEIAEGVDRVCFHADKDAIRHAAREKIRRDYNAARNYPAFISDVQSLLT